MTVRPFLLLTLVVWSAAAWSAHGYLRGAPHRRSFWVCFLLTMAGNVGVVLAPDVIGFYASYAVMTFAAYGLVVHERSPSAYRAGRVYMVMAVAGELLLMPAFVLLVGTAADLSLADVPAAIADAPRRDLIVTLLLLGFGIKAGAVPLHVWLPLAHPVAPTPASAVLSGAMIKAGLFGWLSFLPLGFAPLRVHGSACVVAGVITIFLGALVGATQCDAKTTLAYSSISQMGFATVAIGSGLSHPEAAQVVRSSLALFALHHAFAKAGLFLGLSVGVGPASVTQRRVKALGMTTAALALAGAPFTSGAAAKLALHDVVARSSGAIALEWLLSLGAVGSTVLVGRAVAFSLETERGEGRCASPMVPWLVLVLLPWPLMVLPAATSLASLAHVWSAAWPVILGVGIALVLHRHPLPAVPAGDLLELVSRGARRLKPARAQIAQGTHTAVTFFLSARARFIARSSAILKRLDRAEATLSSFAAVGALALVLLAVLLLVMAPR